jgi:amidase
MDAILPRATFRSVGEVSARDLLTSPADYTQFINPNGLKGARIGITRAGLNGFDPFVPTPQLVLEAIEASFQALKDAGATVIDLDAQGFVFPPADGEFFVLLYDFKGDVAKYFKTRVGVPVAGANLQSAINFNNAHTDVEMPFFNQDIFELAETIKLDANFVDPIFGISHNQALDIDQNAGVNGIDAAISQFHLDRVVSATDNPAWATDLIYAIVSSSELQGWRRRQAIRLFRFPLA